MSQSRTASVTPLVRNRSNLEEDSVGRQPSFPESLGDIGADDQITIKVKGEDRETLACNGFQSHLSHSSESQYGDYTHVSPVEMDPMVLKGQLFISLLSSGLKGKKGVIHVSSRALFIRCRLSMHVC